MFRRISTASLASVSAVRFYKPSEELKKLYASDFEKAAFPTNIVPSDSVLFAKFLYKASEPKNNFDAIIKDFQTIAAAAPSLPVFWERTCKVDDIKEFKGLNEATIFTLQWMQSNGMLDLLPDVAAVYEAYANAKLKRVAAKVYVAPGKTGDKAILDQAKAAAEKIVKENKEFAGFTVVYKTIVERSITEGFAMDVQGHYVNNAKGVEKSKGLSSAEADYTAIPAPHPPKTRWDDNIETEVLRKYLDSLAAYDAEEVKTGV